MKYRSLISLFVFAPLFAIACQSQAQLPAAEAESTPQPEPAPTVPIEDAEPEAGQEAVALVDDAEPGEPLTVMVQVVDGVTGEAVPEAELYVRQTDDGGLYHEDADGVPRIHGRLQSDTAGMVQFRTVLPGRYPDDPTATRHIHLSVTAADYEPLERVLLFDNDPYLTAEEIAWEFSVIAPMVATEKEGWSTEIELALLPAVADELQTFTLTLIAEESLASYRVEEAFLDKPDWLARHGLVPGLATAVGTTQAITGSLQFDLSQVPPRVGENNFTVDLMSLTSDQVGRDNSVRRELFGDGRFPTASFAIESLADFPDQLRAGDTVSFQMSGPLTIREQTKMVTFAVTAVWQDDTISGTATADIQLSDFGLAPPSLLGILTVSEQVSLVLDFYLQAEGG